MDISPSPGCYFQKLLSINVSVVPIHIFRRSDVSHHKFVSLMMSVLVLAKAVASAFPTGKPLSA